MNLDTIEGLVLKTRFGPLDDGYTVMTVRIDGMRDEATAVAWMPADAQGSNFNARGSWVVDPKYGRQFKCAAFGVMAPRSEDQIKARLETYPGVGPSMAAKIVARFGKDTWHVMDTSIGSLLQISGFGKSKLRDVEKYHAKQNGPVAKIQNRLIELGAPPRLAMPIYEAFQADSIQTLERHPYRVASKVAGFGFQLAEKIGRRVGLDLEGPERIDAGIMHEFGEAHSHGHCAMPPKEATDRACKLLRVRGDVVNAGLDRLTKAKTLKLRTGEIDSGFESLIYTSGMSWTESQVAHSVARLASADHPAWDVGDLPDNLSRGQRAAVEAIAASGVAIITGGPGTGKSTVVDNVVKLAVATDTHVILCAPTGRAAKRMSEATGQPASTIHRLLGSQPGTFGFRHDRDNPLKVGLIVIDEASMLDVRLADSLFQALTPKHRVLIVGDADQLPSVGPGNVLRDIIDAAEATGKVPVVRLVEVFRQAAGSTIIVNAHRILEGDTLDPDPPSKGAAGEFYVLRASDAHDAHKTIIRMATERVPQAYGLDRLTEVQVLCPMHKGPAGTEAMNTTLQRRYTAQGEGFGTKLGRRFFKGDRVMQTKNDYERNVFNGDVGTVTAVDMRPSSDAVMNVDFDGVTAAYTRADIGPAGLILAYAMSIHKSQGSEFPAVLIPMLMSHRIMLRRNLLYTAITRARRLCVIVGEPRAIKLAIETADAAERWTGLDPRLRELLTRASGGS